MKAIQELMEGALALPVSALPYYIGRRFSDLCPGRAVLETSDGDFAFDNFVTHGGCERTTVAEVFARQALGWYGSPREATTSLPAALFEVRWGDHVLQVLRVAWVTSCGEARGEWICAPTEAIARAFFHAVCDFSRELHAEVLVFEEGDWDRSTELYDAIRGTTLESLVLTRGLKEEILHDVGSFFGARELYAEHEIPWKRGVLLLGPPGNGKTHAIKGLVNSLDLPCLYAKSFHVEGTSDSRQIKAVFERARSTAPCFLVFEDLDSLVTDENRSFFLNELDGFASNNGILTIATTNHPERLDSAIVDRPSRFDRKYHFTLPDIEERRAYFALWASGLKDALRPSGSAVNETAERTAGFSFAYLKELTVSALLRWIERRESGSMSALLLESVSLLRAQMSSDVSAAPNASSQDTTED